MSTPFPLQLGTAHWLLPKWKPNPAVRSSCIYFLFDLYLRRTDNYFPSDSMVLFAFRIFFFFSFGLLPPAAGPANQLPPSNPQNSPNLLLSHQLTSCPLSLHPLISPSAPPLGLLLPTSASFTVSSTDQKPSQSVASVTQRAAQQFALYDLQRCPVCSSVAPRL